MSVKGILTFEEFIEHNKPKDIEVKDVLLNPEYGDMNDLMWKGYTTYLKNPGIQKLLLVYMENRRASRKTDSALPEGIFGPEKVYEDSVDISKLLEGLEKEFMRGRVPHGPYHPDSDASGMFSLMSYVGQAAQIPDLKERLETLGAAIGALKERTGKSET